MVKYVVLKSIRHETKLGVLVEAMIPTQMTRKKKLKKKKLFKVFFVNWFLPKFFFTLGPPSNLKLIPSLVV
jgi:hypothetical protein